MEQLGTPRFELEDEYEGETFGGTVIDASGTSGQNPIVNVGKEHPRVIVDNEHYSDWEEGETMNGIKIHSVKDSYMFGRRISSQDEPGQEDEVEQKGEMEVILTIIGNEMVTSFDDPQDAEDFADILKAQLDMGRVEVR